MKLALLGVRGSTPAPGPAFLRYGGHTSCVAVLDDDGRVVVVLDAGTGVRELPRLLGGSAYRGPLVLSHLHWDHLHGLPFCPALDAPDAEVELWVPPADDGQSARELLTRVMSPPFFPIGPSGLLGRWTFRTAGTGRLDGTFGAARVELAPVRHKGGRTWAVRVDLDGSSVAYVPDHTLVTYEDGAFVDRSADDVEAIELIHGVDVLLHDGQFVGSEGRLAAEYGHSTIEDVVRWADRCAVGSLVLTHHAPTRSDDALDALAEKFATTPDGRPVTFARQGELLTPR